MEVQKRSLKHQGQMNEIQKFKPGSPQSLHNQSEYFAQPNPVAETLVTCGGKEETTQ